MIKTYTLTTNDAERWRAVLPVDLCVPGSLEYLRICERQFGHAARLFVVEDEHPIAAYPYLVRPAAGLPFANGAGARCIDTTTPEYRGPIWLNGGPPPGADASWFPSLFARHCAGQRIIAEFAHLHPWIAEEMLDPQCITADREIVYVDLTWTEEEIWMRSLSSDARRQTKQGQKAGVRVRRAESPDDVRAFYGLYTGTMERRQALGRYFFPLEYFMAFFETMPANAFFLLAEFEGRPVAGGLYFQDRTEVYWHLSAADREFGHVRPVNVYLFESIRQALGKGRKRMILGGGYASDDGVFRFKANFSPLRARFCTYRRIHDPAAYAALTDAWSAFHGEAPPRNGFFPAYRALPSKTPAPGDPVSAASTASAQ